MRIRLPRWLTAFAASARRLLGRWPRPSAGNGKPFEPYVNRLIATAIQFNEIPSPTEKERQRAQFIRRRLNELGIGEAGEDPEANLSVLLPASSSTDEAILLFANLENDAYSPLDSLVNLAGNRATGRGIADNSLGVAALLVLAEYLQANQQRFARNVLLLFTRMQAAGDRFTALEGFIKRWRGSIPAALYVKGIQLGELGVEPVGTCRLTVHVKTRERDVLAGAGAGSAVAVLADIAFRLGRIRWDMEGCTTLNLARIDAGLGPGYYADEGVMELEIFSRGEGPLELARSAVTATIRNAGEECKASIRVEENGLIPVPDPETNRALIAALRRVHRRLGIRSRRVSTPDPAAVLNAHRVPALTVGITTGKKTFREESIDLRPVAAGFRQLLLLLETLGGS
jgi:acetylornithine deacetylase/succinyl-diaminopimelate desuccinylase-like protein